MQIQIQTITFNLPRFYYLKNMSKLQKQNNTIFVTLKCINREEKKKLPMSRFERINSVENETFQTDFFIMKTSCVCVSIYIYIYIYIYI